MHAISLQSAPRSVVASRPRARCHQTLCPKRAVAEWQLLHVNFYRIKLKHAFCVAPESLSEVVVVVVLNAGRCYPSRLAKQLPGHPTTFLDCPSTSPRKSRPVLWRSRATAGFPLYRKPIVLALRQAEPQKLQPIAAARSATFSSCPRRNGEQDRTAGFQG